MVGSLALVLAAALASPARAYVWKIDDSYSEEILSFSELYMVGGRRERSPRALVVKAEP